MTKDTKLTEAIAVFFGQKHRNAQRSTARNNAHFVNRIVLFDHAADNCMPSFVIGSISTLFVRHNHRLALGAHHDLVFRFLKFFHRDQTLT